MAVERIVNVGSLVSVDSLVEHLSYEFLELRNEYLIGKRPKIVFDFRYIDKHGRINIAALASLLAIGKKIRDFIGYPILTLMEWNPNVSLFLIDTHFFSIAQRLNIFEINGDMLGTIRFNNDRINPNTKLIYFDDVIPISSIPFEKIGEVKALHKQRIIGNLKVRSRDIFANCKKTLHDVIMNTTLELIVNSLMHAEEYAFVAFQRTKTRITISVCDSGIGFKRSLQKTFPYDSFKSLDDAEAIFIGSLVQKNIHGLRLAISEILDYDENNNENGWVTISSYKAEIKWQKNNWSKAIKYFDNINLETQKINLSEIMESQSKRFLKLEDIKKGYFKTYPHFVIGTRISFDMIFPSSETNF